MVLNETLTTHKAFLTSAMFARKFDPSIYSDVFQIWDNWMEGKMKSQGLAPRQPSIGQSLTHADPMLRSNIPGPTPHETDPFLEGDESYNPFYAASRSGAAAAAAGGRSNGGGGLLWSSSSDGGGGGMAPLASRLAQGLAMHGLTLHTSASNDPATAPRTNGGLGALSHLARHLTQNSSSSHAPSEHGDHEHHDHEEDDHGDGHDHAHEGQTGVAAGFLLFWVVGLLLMATCVVCRMAARELWVPGTWRLRLLSRAKHNEAKAF